MAPDSAFYVVVVYATCAVLLGWLYFRPFRVTRPPIGVFDLRDVALMIGAIVLVPILYLAVPPWLEATLLGLGLLAIMQVTFEPVVPGRWTAWAVALVLLGPTWGPRLFSEHRARRSCSPTTSSWRSLSLVPPNLWVQSGMKARDVAVLGAALVVYDFVATSLLPLMNDLTGRLGGLPSNSAHSIACRTCAQRGGPPPKVE